MAVNRYAGLKRNILLATALSATLGGCASVEYDKVANGKASHQVVPMPKQATETAYAAPANGQTVAPVAAAGPTLEAQSALLENGQAPALVPVPTANPLTASAASPAASSNPVLMQPVISDASAGGNPLLQATVTPGAELAYAPPTLVAVPQPRPDIIAAANTIPTAGGDEPATAQTSTPVGSSAEKDIQFLQQRLATATPTDGAPEPLLDDVAVPTPRPDPQSMGLEAYASTPGMMAMDAYDVSAPKDLQAAPRAAAASDIAPSSKLQTLISKYAALYQVPEALVHRVIRRESRYNPSAYSRGNYGLMQIRFNTARSLGYQGTPSGLFDAETNLKYAVKYLRGAFMVADNNHDNAVRLYARGYYYDAKRKGLLAQVQ